MLIRKSNYWLIATILILAYSLPGLINAQNKIAKDNWPQFRGVQASGVADAPDIATQWDAESGHNIKWRTPIQGLGLSSPVVWGDKVFITTAVGEGRENDPPPLRVGLYGDIGSEEEDYPHLFQVICLDKNTGKVTWSKTAHKGIPQVKRHTKASHANCTVATDGKHVIAFFGSEGLYGYSMDGDVLWKKDLGYLNPGFFSVPGTEWGFASSPVIHKGWVITQCDVDDRAFIAAFDAASGNEIWRTIREDMPTWCTPTVVNVNGKDQIVVNGWKRRAGYDFETGEEIWFMNGGGDIPTPTPIIAHGMSFYSSSHGRIRPLYAIKLEAKGDISLEGRELSNEFVVWSNPRRGAYMPTPIIVGDYLYVGNNAGILTCYKAKTGEEVYRERIGGVRSSYTGSAVSAADKLYYSDEDGTIHVIEIGPNYKHLASNRLREPILTTPAISGKMILIRTSRALYGIEELNKAGEAKAKEHESAEKMTFPEMPEFPKEPLTDATEIFKLTDAASKAVHTIQYNIAVEGVGDFAPRTPKGSARVTESGWGDYTPAFFKIIGEVIMPNAQEATPLLAGFDGDKLFIVNHADKLVHADYEYDVLGRNGRVVMGSLVNEFCLDEPFSDEIGTPDKTLKGIVDVEGEPCYEIMLKFDNDYDSESTYWISTKDYLIRKRMNQYTIQSGARGGSVYTLTNLRVNPQIKDGFYKIPIPEGYRLTNNPPE